MGPNGFRQIYYTWQDEKIFITNTPYPNGEPDTENEYITWMGQSTDGAWQVFLYDILTGTTIQLSTSSNNANPKVSDGKLTWEGWVDGTWQIFLFDGIKIKQITSGEPSINPDIDRNYLIYATRHTSGQWKSVAYSFAEDRSVDMFIGPETKHTGLKNGQVSLLSGSVVNVSSFFELDLGTLGSPATPSATPVPPIPPSVDQTEILEELLLPATPSATPMPAITPEASPAPATESGTVSL